MSELIDQKEYKNWFEEVKLRIQNRQIKVAVTVNSALLSFYWDLGKMIVLNQEDAHWGNAVVEQLAKDLKREYPGIGGFSRTNLFAVRQFYLFYRSSSEKIPQAVGQIPWGHNRLIIGKIKNVEEAIFYAESTIENNWSRSILALQIESDLYRRQGEAITNFKATLPAPNSDLARETLKDPYVFDFLTLEKNAQELEIEEQLVKHITKFLLELGKGFAFIGNQYHLEVNGKSYYLDLLFYHVKLRCFVVIELKAGEFKPEYVGKLNFYLSAVDELLKNKNDHPTIGILLCKEKDKVDVEFALRDIGKPIGVSEFEITKIVPEEIKTNLPTVEQIEKELFDDKELEK